MTNAQQNSSNSGFKFAEYGADPTNITPSNSNALFSNNGNLTNQAGTNFILTDGLKTYAAIGDSIIDFGDFFGRHFASPVNLTGVVMNAANIAIATGNGVIEHRYNSATKIHELRWTAPGDTSLGGSPWITVVSGKYNLPSAVSNSEIRVGVKLRELPLSNTIDIVASGVIEWARKGFLYALDTLTFHRFNILPNYGVAGAYATDIIRDAYLQPIQAGANIVIENAGTNDNSLLGLSPEVIAAARVANWDFANQYGVTVLAMLISPRWGFDAAGVTTPTNPAYVDSVNFTATRQATQIAVNRILMESARSRPWIKIIDTNITVTDSTLATGQAKNGYTVDGLHDSGGSSYERARQLKVPLNIIDPSDPKRINVGGGSYYNSVTNKGGNLLPSNQGSFAGTTGSAGTGITIGTGLATGTSSARVGSGTIVATANKVVATDGGPDWQEFAISGAGAIGETVGIFFGSPSLANIPLGGFVEWSVEFLITGTGCGGIYVDYTFSFSDGSAYNVKNNSLQNVVQGLRNGESGVIVTQPFPLQSNITGIFPRVLMQSNTGATFTVWLRIADFRNIIAPI